MGDTTREKWDTDKMREHRNDWSLAADIHLFSYLQQFSQNLLSETHSTLKALDNFESDIATTCVEVSNIGNRFWALSDTQFVENRVYDDDDVTSPVAPTTLQPEDNETVAIQRLKEAIQNGIQVLDSKFAMIQVPASDSDEEDSSPHSGVILKPVNKYKERRLPHLIGSAEFSADDTLGLCDAASDEETDDFVSASDKANDSDSMGESEDSDIESDQTKTQHVLPQKPSSNMFDPHSLRLPGLKNVQATSNASSPPSGDVFGEQGDDDLFSAMASKKPTFSSWQPSDLWASEEEDEKRLGDNIRPPSANSSISSAQSSNKSEPIKKTSEVFGKSGTGRQAVLVQDDQSDLFGPKADPITPQTKEFVPAGGVKIFGGDFNPFSSRNQSKESSGAPAAEHDRSEKDEVDDIFANKSNIPTKVLPKVPSSNVFSNKNEISLFHDEDEDDLFSTKANEPKEKSHPPSLPSNRILFGSNKSEPEDEDFFGHSSLFTDSKTKLSHSLFKDDLFGDASEHLFSKVDREEQKTDKLNSASKSLDDSLFSNQGPSSRIGGSRGTGDKVSLPKSQAQKLDNDIFGDGEDLFGNVGKINDDLFGEAPIAAKPSSSLTSKEGTKIQGSKPLSKDLFDGSYNDNDDLFSPLSKSFTTDQKPVVDQNSLFGNKNNTSLKTGKQEVSAVEDDLFGASTITADLKNKSIKGRPSVLKPKKGLEKRLLFDSDSDDDLFSSPQGSLSSRKSVQSTSEPSDLNEREDKKKPSKDSTVSRAPKTDFSSIFSNSQDETPGFTLDKEKNKSSNLFGDDEDLFSSLSSNVRTPDLFSNNKSLSKSVVGQENDININQAPKGRQNEIKTNTVPEGSKTENLLEALNKNVAKKSEHTPVQSGSLKTDIFSDNLSKNEDDSQINKKLDPPKTLNVKPISETLMDSKLDESKSKKITEDHKPPVSKKPSTSVLVDKPISKDSTDGEVISPPTPSKPAPGKLKASQLIQINTAALLPGARLSKIEPNLEPQAPISSDVEAQPELKVSPIQVIPTNIPDMPPKSSLLQSVNKERVKVQGKRRPSSRRARQEALRSSSLDAGTEADSIGTSIAPATSTLMSPSTDEEDLFGVPPLDVVYDVKTVSPSIDIFGTPTVLSPVTNKELPSTFVSTPFVHSQPPPLDEEQEEGSNQEDDLFESQSNLLSSLTKDKKPSVDVKGAPFKKGVSAKDIFSDFEEDGLFRGIKEAPPPLVDDENDDDENYDGLFMTRNKIDNVFSKPSHSGSVIATLESLPKEDPMQSKPSHLTGPASSLSFSDPQKIQGSKDDSKEDPLFSSNNSTISDPSSLFSTLEPNLMTSEDFIFSKSSKNSTEGTKDSSNNPSKKPSDILEDLGHAKDMKKDSIFSDPGNETASSLFAKPNSDIFSDGNEISSKAKPASLETKPKEDSIFSNSGSEEDTLLFAKGKKATSDLFADNKILRTIPDHLETESKEDENSVSDDELFGSHSKSSTVKSSSAGEKFNKPLKMKDERSTKKHTLFSEDEEEAGNLFSSISDKKVKVKQSVKSSLFEDEDDDNIFGSLSSNKSTAPKSVPSTSEGKKGSSSKATKTANTGSSKPVKLETKQTFSDPLLSHEDQ